ncbi:M20 family metallopeptidase [Caldisphaera sp.]|jgi:succinyl-diaminopimelate desuccinylase|uniref:M20 family metallopeptidase n=1 Tax=Caldisphaera sp. TaxID=2060322 RepID=UPI00397C6D30
MDIDDAIYEIKKDMIDFLIKIINIPTENPPGLNYEKFTDYVSDYLLSLGYNVEIVKPNKEELKQLVRYGNGERPNIIATYGNNGVKIGFNSHYDVVPAGKGWLHDPYNAVIDDGKIYGRGSSDMKSGIAVQIYALEALKMVYNIKNITVKQFIVPDEETVGNKNAGTYYLVEKGYISSRNLDYLIFTEPLNPTNVGIGHRGALWGTFKLTGIKSHGGFPQKGNDTIRCAAKLINYIYETLSNKSNIISKYPIIPESSRKPSYLIGTINGGDWMNTVSDYLSFSYVRRLIPEEKIEQAIDEINDIINFGKKECPGIKIEFEQYYVTDSIIFEKSHGINLISKLIKEVYNVEPSLILSPGTFDIRFVYNKGIDTFNYGPGLLELAHATDEYVYIEDLIKSTKVLALFLKYFIKQ